MCSVYASALAPNTTYAVHLAPAAAAGGDVGQSAAPPPVQTAQPQYAPSLAPGAGVTPGSVGAYGFALSGLQQDQQVRALDGGEEGRFVLSGFLQDQQVRGLDVGEERGFALSGQRQDQQERE